MVDGIFTRLQPKNADALQKLENSALSGLVDEIDIEDLSAALTGVANEIEITHSSLQKIYEEANYVHSRLIHMEKSVTAKQTSNKEDEDAGDGGSGVVDREIKKTLFATGGSIEEKLAKIQNAKELTKSLLQSIEILSEKVQGTNVNRNKLNRSM